MPHPTTLQTLGRAENYFALNLIQGFQKHYFFERKILQSAMEISMENPLAKQNEIAQHFWPEIFLARSLPPNAVKVFFSLP